MKVTTLIENKPSMADARLVAEWGLSLHIAFHEYNILFDTGASEAFAKNAEHLSVNLADINAAVLSHHHFDHGGGLRRFLELNSLVKVFLGEAPDGDCFSSAFGMMRKYIGLDKALFTDYPDRFETVHEPTEILPDVFVLPHILDNRPKPRGNRYIFLKKDHTLALDDFAHEVVMAIKEDGKLVVFTGCSHNGILNMVDTVAKAFDGTPIKAVIGGFHLIVAPMFNFIAGSKGEVRELARSIVDYPVGVTYTGHCTGAKAFSILKGVMGERLEDIHTGSCFEV